MKTFLSVLLFAVAIVCAQGPTWTTSTIQAYQGYDYELWNQNNSGTVKMEITGDNGSGANAKGGTFKATWSGTENVLFRSGKKWGASSTTTVSSIGNATVDFAATWSSGDNVKMLGIYGWAYYPSGSEPTKNENGQSNNFSNQIEYYIIQDRGSYNSAAQGTNSKKYGSATIDGIAYDFYVADRLNQPMLTGNGNFKQYFSVPASTGSHRTSGVVTVSKHFSEWERVGMKMSSCRLYEIAMKVESYTGSGKNSNGSATVTKNLLTIGGSVAPTPSSSSIASTTSSSSRASSSSGSSSPVSCNYQTSFCGGMSFSEVAANSTAAPAAGVCVYIGDFEVIQPSLSSTVSINGVENTCGADWDNCPYNTKPSAIDGGYYVFTKTGTINRYEDNGWKGIVAKSKPNCTSFTQLGSSSSRASSSSAASSSSRASSSSAAASSSSRASSSSVASSSSGVASSSSGAASSSSETGTSSSSEESSPGAESSSSEESIPSEESSSSATSDSSSSGALPSSSSSNEVSPIRMLSSIPSAAFQIRAMSNGSLLIESHAKTAVYLYDTRGNLAQKIQAPAGSSVVQAAVPAGVYVVKNAANRQTQMVVVK